MCIKVTRAGVFDAATIASIGKKSFRNTFGHVFSNKEELLEYLEYTYDTDKLVRSLQKNSNIYYLALLDGKPAGFAKVKIDSLNDNIESISQLELQKVYVLPECQGSGIGTALLNRVRKLCSDINPDYLWLDVHTGNEKAISFYERNGFQKIGKYFFTIGSQVFEYYVMGLPVAFGMETAC